MTERQRARLPILAGDDLIRPRADRRLRLAGHDRRDALDHPSRPLQLADRLLVVRCRALAGDAIAGAAKRVEMDLLRADDRLRALEAPPRLREEGAEVLRPRETDRRVRHRSTS